MRREVPLFILVLSLCAAWPQGGHGGAHQDPELGQGTFRVKNSAGDIVAWAWRTPDRVAGKVSDEYWIMVDNDTDPMNGNGWKDPYPGVTVTLTIEAMKQDMSVNTGAPYNPGTYTEFVNWVNGWLSGDPARRVDKKLSHSTVVIP